MIKVSLLTFSRAPKALLEQGEIRIEKIIPRNYLEFTDQDPDVLFFLTGGSENSAVKKVSSGRFYLLIGSRHDNSYASATEVKAYLDQKNIPSQLLDEEEEETRDIVMGFLNIRQSLNNLKGKRLGLIGEISDWLISSSIPADILESKLGIRLIKIPWSEAGHFSNYDRSDQFLDFYSNEKKIDLHETARVSELLTTAIQKWKLDALTVECFPMVQKSGVTACLPLAKFNHYGIPAGCEGDLCAIAGMMLCKELTGIIPWMANINKVTGEACVFSHCTIAPGLVSDYTIMSHFETGKGTAIQGSFKGDQVTIFRFDNTLSKAFITSAEITGRPKSETACRTQIEVNLTKDTVRLLREEPLGNHHLIIPGEHKKTLTLSCLFLGIKVLQ